MRAEFLMLTPTCVLVVFFCAFFAEIKGRATEKQKK